MGGRGSGGHNSKGRLRDVQCARLDVHELAGEGKLKLGVRGWLFGTIWFEVTGGPDAQQLVLEFPRKSTSGEPLDPLRQVIGCHWREAHFGGRHLVFMCNECNRAARVLYARYANNRKLPQMRWHHLSVHNGPSVGPFSASRREVTRSARMARARYRADQTARYA
jgi:hypothetical protein